MNIDGYRINGGLGFSVSSPSLSLQFEPHDAIDILDERTNGFSGLELEKLKNHIQIIQVRNELKLGLKCVILDGSIIPHVGFGSSTMAYMACTEALFLLNNKNVEADDVISQSRRGGTSGIGINTYFKGGFIFDAGVKNNDKQLFMPSSSFVINDHAKPLLLKHVNLPHWELGICIPPISPKTENEEKLFFQDNCPIEKNAVDETLYEAVYGIIPSLIEKDFQVFCKTIDAIQQTRWKSLERNLYGVELIEIENYIRKAGAQCVGMSSFGPLLYFFGKNLDFIIKRIKNENPQCKCFKTSFNNLSRIVEND